MTKQLILTLPIYTVSESNSSENRFAKAKRHEMQQKSVWYAYKEKGIKVTSPCKIKIVRLAPRSLDDDNLVMAMKWVRDEIASLINPEKIVTVNRNGCSYLNKGHCDNDPNMTFEYGQEKARLSGIRIEIEWDFSS